MPASTSTPTALLSEAHPWRGSGWRSVEAQHMNATLSLASGNLRDQEILENIIDEVKPPLPVAAQGLHFLLSTPFRYWPRPPEGSRFRRRTDPGVFYGAEDIRTACAEAGYWRLHFWLDSEALSKKPTAIQMTLFEFHGAAQAMIDLTKSPLSIERAKWVRSDEYRDTQQLASLARSEGIEVIRSESVRNPPDGRCLAVLTPSVFKSATEPYRHNNQTWTLYIRPPGLTVWQRSMNNDSFEFQY